MRLDQPQRLSGQHARWTPPHIRGRLDDPQEKRRHQDLRRSPAGQNGRRVRARQERFGAVFHARRQTGRLPERRQDEGGGASLRVVLGELHEGDPGPEKLGPGLLHEPAAQRHPTGQPSGPGFRVFQTIMIMNLMY